MVLLILFSGLALQACGDPYYDEIVLEADVPIDRNTHSSSFIDLQITWTSPWYRDTDLDLEVQTPHQHLVTARRDWVDDCSHFGNDLGIHGGGIEEVLCQDPVSGIYEAQIFNNSNAVEQVFVTTEQRIAHWDHDEVIDFSESVVVEPWTRVIVPIRVF